MTASPAPRSLEVPGGRLAYDEAGPSHGIPVVLLHQAIADRRVWDALVPALAQKHHVVRYDARGFGNSPPAREGFSSLDDLSAVVAHLKLERPLLIGASMGGRLALDFALAHPGTTRGLLLIGPGFSGMDYPMFPAGIFEDDERISKAAQEAFTAGRLDDAIEQVRRLWGAALTGAELERFRTMVRENTEEVFLERSGQHDRPVQPKAADQLSTLKVPLLVLVGDRDNPAMPHVARYLADHVPGARMRLVPGTDHLMNLGAPRVVGEAAEEMLAADRRG